ncbi:hypothetical protein [Alkalihalophilus marmarensis]|nr:hypothetical protein [Alkalihalophilus marmarensis]MEC2073753.1 hypothetical protein [Alkalihalophilus marmarensis]
MQRGKKVAKAKMYSIEYIHDPEATKLWMEMCIKLLKDQVINTSTKE